MDPLSPSGLPPCLSGEALRGARRWPLRPSAQSSLHVDRAAFFLLSRARLPLAPAVPCLACAFALFLLDPAAARAAMPAFCVRVCFFVSRCLCCAAAAHLSLPSPSLFQARVLVCTFAPTHVRLSVIIAAVLLCGQRASRRRRRRCQVERARAEESRTSCAKARRGQRQL